MEIASANRKTVKGPVRFRRRLIIGFVVIVGLAAGAPAIGSYAVVDHQRYDLFQKRSLSQTQLVLSLTRGEDSASRADSLVNAARARSGSETLIVADTVVSSDPSITVDRVPKDLKVEPGRLTAETTQIGHERYFVVASEIPESTDHAVIYNWFSQDVVLSTLREMRNVLIGSWIAVMVLAAIAGRIVAIRTLAPIQLAAESARLRAEGLLNTPLKKFSNDEFQAWAHYFNDIATALEDKIEELSSAHEQQRRFTSDVAHDLRTPLGSMVSAVSILKEYVSEMPQDARRPAELLIGDVARLRRLVTDLLEMGRLDSNREEPARETIDVEALLNSVVLSLQKQGQARIAVSGAPRVYSDRVRLERILANLIENAFVHGGDDVNVNASVESHQLVIDVTDKGPGIPEDQLERIFDRFHKVSESRTGGGSGLGLAIAAQHTAILGGTLTASNVDSGGTNLHLVVPVTTQEVEEIVKTEGFVTDRR